LVASVLLTGVSVGGWLGIGPSGTAGSAATAAALVGPSWVVDRARFEMIDDSLPVGVDGMGNYRGAIEVVHDGSGLAVVNTTSLTDYLNGVSEMPSSWPAAALQAQAIAARSYLLYTLMGPRPTELAAVGAQICATDACQVYSGLAKVQAPNGAAWAAAVAATSGQVVEYHGLPIEALYSSSNGGRSVGGGKPYLVPVDDPDDALSPLHRWVVHLDASQLAVALSLPGPLRALTRSGDTITLTSAGPGPGPSSTTSARSGAQPSSMSAPGSRSTTTTTTTPGVLGMATGPAASAGGGSSGSQGGGASQSGQSGQGSSTGSGPGRGSSGSGSSSGSSGGNAGGPSGTSGEAADRQSEQTTAMSVGDFLHKVNSVLPAPADRNVLIPSPQFEPASPPRASDIVLSGRGFGHGVGMSQYGALGKALRGMDAAGILAAYYGGLRPVEADPASLAPTVAAALAREQPEVVVTGRFRVVDHEGRVITPVADGPWRVEPGPHGDVRVIAPPVYAAPFRVEGLTVEPARVVPGARAQLEYLLPVPAVVQVRLTSPDGTRTNVDTAHVAGAGRARMTLPALAALGDYRILLKADAGPGRLVDAAATVTVTTPPLALGSLARFDTGGSVSSGRSTARTVTIGLLAACAALISVAVLATALEPRHDWTWDPSDAARPWRELG